jgi:branched-chain amino acid aminotransferase
VALPPLPVNDFVDAITKALSLDQRWIPTGENMSLYIRPFMIATEAFIGLRAAEVADFYVIFSPVGAYVEGVAKIWLETKYFRATPGGTGAAKCGGNYAASLLAKMLAHEKGCTDSLYLDAKTAKYIEEFSGMSFFAVQSDGTLISPKISDTILDSITRKSIIQIAKDNKIKFVEKDIDYKKLLADIKSKKIAEVFACGTAAVVSPVGVIKGEGFEVTVGDGKFGKISKFLKEELVGIQRGEKPDKHK